MSGKMMWMLFPAGLFFFRGKIAGFLAPYLPVLNPQKTAMLGHMVTLGAGFVYILPVELAGLGAVKRPMFMLSMWSTILTCMSTIKANIGLPAISMPGGLSLSTIKSGAQTAMMQIQPWLQKAMMSPDFAFLFFALIFLTAYPSVAPLVILGRKSLWTVCTLAEKEMPENRSWLRFKPIWENKLKPKTEQVTHYAALAEIALGFYLVVCLMLPTRQLLATLLYWNYLTTRYKVPRSRKHHGPAWKEIGDRFEPVFKALPILRKPVTMAQGFFDGPSA